MCFEGISLLTVSFREWREFGSSTRADQGKAGIRCTAVKSDKQCLR